MKQHMAIGVLGLPVSKDGKFLLSQRHDPKNRVVHHKWQIAGGGLEFGEEVLQTLSREMQEELCVSVDLLYPHPIVKTSTWYGKDTNNDHDSHIILLVYLVSIGDQQPTCHLDDETNDVQWFNFDEAIHLDSLPNTREILLEAREILETAKYFQK